MEETQAIAASQEALIHELSAKLHDLSAQINNIVEKENEFKGAEKELDVLRSKRGGIEGEAANLKANMGDILDHSQAELEDMAKEFDKEVGEVEVRLAKVQAAKERADKELQAILLDSQRKSEALYKAQVKLEQLQKQQEMRDKFLKETARVMHESPFSREEVDSLIEQICSEAKKVS